MYTIYEILYNQDKRNLLKYTSKARDVTEIQYAERMGKIAAAPQKISYSLDRCLDLL